MVITSKMRSMWRGLRASEVVGDAAPSADDRVNTQFVRFCLVGLLNTAVDAGLFTVLHAGGTGLVLANGISTSCGLLLSLVLNARYTFGGRRITVHLIELFLVITLVGLWGLQPAIIGIVSGMLGWNASDGVMLHALLPKLAAISVTLVWNFVWYRRVVFAKR